MSDRIVRFKAGTVEGTAVLNDSSTADKLWEALPITSAASTWGDEIYFRVPVEAEEDGAQEVVSMGDVAFWPPGQALCLFFGPTPASRGDEIRPASPVNVVGRIEGDATIFKQVKSGATVTVEKA